MVYLVVKKFLIVSAIMDISQSPVPYYLKKIIIQTLKSSLISLNTKKVNFENLFFIFLYIL